MRLFVLVLFLVGFGSLHGQDSLKFEFSDSVFLVGQEKNVEIRFTYCAPVGGSVFDADMLDSIRVFLLSKKSIRISITHHTDTRGSTDANIDISKLRALSVKSELVGLGISEDRITALGKGESEPIYSETEINQYKETNPEKYEQLHQINRRTIIKITHI